MAGKIKNIGIEFKITILFIIAHCLLALVFKANSVFVMVHAWVCFIAGINAAIKGKQWLVACIVSYIVGSEVLWRMAGPEIVFWEFGKYASAAIFFVAALRVRGKASLVKSVILYFIFLLPAIILLDLDSMNEWRKIVSANLSGPIVLLASALFFSRFSCSKQELKKILMWGIGPVISVGIIVLLSIIGASEIKWGASSSAVSSGGFGPNQVSVALATGAFFCIIMVFLQKKKILKSIFLTIALLLFAQSLLTFSRGGVIESAIATGVFFIYLVGPRGGKYFKSAVVLGIICVVVMSNYIVPKLDSFTEGGLSKRYSEKEEIAENMEFYTTTHRIALIKADIKGFLDNPFFGQGLGSSTAIHRKYAEINAQTHTEWSRLLLEHGMFGMMAIVFLMIWMKKRSLTAKTALSRAIFRSFAVKAIFYMFHAGMRTALPGFLIGFLAVEIDESEVEQTSQSINNQL